MTNDESGAQVPALQTLSPAWKIKRSARSVWSAASSSPLFLILLSLASVPWLNAANPTTDSGPPAPDVRSCCRNKLLARQSLRQ